MPQSIVSLLWTPEQIILTASIVTCCLALALGGLRRRGASVPVDEGRAEPAGGSDGISSAAIGMPPWGWIILGVGLTAVALFLLQRGGDPLGVRLDSWADSNVIVSGRNYVRTGLRANSGVPQHQTITDTNPSDPFFLYTNYPMAPNWINGLWQMAGVTSHRAYRSLPAVCSMLGVLVWFGLFRRFAGPPTAVLAALTMATSYAYLALADALHFHAYGFLLVALVVRCVVHALAPETRHRARWLLLAAVLNFALAWFTWEYHIGVIVFVLAYSLLFACPIRRVYLGLLIVPFLMAFALQAAQEGHVTRIIEQAGMARGDAGAGLRVFLRHLHRRALGFDYSIDTPEGLTLRNYPLWVFLRFYRFYGLPIGAAAAMAVLLLLYLRRGRQAGRGSDAAIRFLLVLIAASPGWWMVMLQHTSVHPHTMRHALPAYSLLMAMVWMLCWRAIRFRETGLIGQAAARLLLVVLLYPQVEGLVCNLRMHWGADFTDERQRTDIGREPFRENARLRELVPPGAVILTDSLLPPMRVASERPVYCGTASYRYPPNDPARSRALLEMRLNHLRQLYHDRLPPLYFAHDTAGMRIEQASARDPFARFAWFLMTGDKTLVTGDRSLMTGVWKPSLRTTVSAVVKDLDVQGRSEQSLCPVQKVGRMLLLFQMDPAVPALRELYDRNGFPTLREFGPSR